MDRTEQNRVTIFDTTLRDGEQSPGISLNTAEKVEIAQQLARLGVDVIEAGFPIASDGDFDSVEAIAKAVRGPIIAGLSRTGFKDVDRAWEAVRRASRWEAVICRAKFELIRAARCLAPRLRRSCSARARPRSSTRRSG